VADLCVSHKNGTQDLRPVRKPKKNVPHRLHAAGVILKGRKVLLAQRPPKELLGGMWEFPNGRVGEDPAKALTKVLRSEYSLKVQRKEAWGFVQHAYTHFKVSVHVFRCDLLSMSNDGRFKWVMMKKLEEYPMGKVDRQIAKTVLKFFENE
jgi:A/G-specific adenine glycosylase